MAPQITGVSVVCSTVCSGADQRKKSKLRVTGLCEGNSLVTGGLPSQKASNAENVSIWWRHHESWTPLVIRLIVLNFAVNMSQRLQIITDLSCAIHNSFKIKWMGILRFPRCNLFSSYIFMLTSPVSFWTFWNQSICTSGLLGYCLGSWTRSILSEVCVTTFAFGIPGTSFAVGVLE